MRAFIPCPWPPTDGCSPSLHVVNGLGRGRAAAGLVGAATTVGITTGGPWRGRMVDRMGLRRALAPSIVVEALVWGTAPFVSYE